MNQQEQTTVKARFETYFTEPVQVMEGDAQYHIYDVWQYTGAGLIIELRARTDMFMSARKLAETQYNDKKKVGSEYYRTSIITLGNGDILFDARNHAKGNK